VCLYLLAIAAFGFVHTPWLDAAANWIARLPLQAGHHVLLRWGEALLGLSAQKFALVGAAATAYATLFAIEGVGLWRGRYWAEYLTLFATASLIPFELWEIHHRFAWLKLLALAVNIAIVIYLWRVARRGG
jgi:uncharacterized membrane protein (DUF2068 family)